MGGTGCIFKRRSSRGGREMGVLIYREQLDTMRHMRVIRIKGEQDKTQANLKKNIQYTTLTSKHP